MNQRLSVRLIPSQRKLTGLKLPFLALCLTGFSVSNSAAQNVITKSEFNGRSSWITGTSASMFTPDRASNPELTAGIDNLTLTLTLTNVTVPEPSSILALASLLVLGILGRNKRERLSK